MGDRCYVELTVLNEHAEQTRLIIGDDSASDESEDEQCTVFGFEEVNYGNLEFLDKLTAAGIAWDSRWHGGDEYGPGTKHLRFTAEGASQEITVHDSEQGVIAVKELQEFLSQSGTVWSSQVTTFVDQHVAAMQPLPWEGQADNGKRHRALKLIGGT
jgi:hypothetical protein